MKILRVFVDERTLAILERVSAETDRSVEELAEAAVSEAAIQSQRGEMPRGN